MPKKEVFDFYDRTILKSYNLDEVVITATKREENLTDANANISVITKEDIERMHYNTIEEALRTVTGIQFLDYKSNHMF